VFFDGSCLALEYDGVDELAHPGDLSLPLGEEVPLQALDVRSVTPVTTPEAVVRVAASLDQEVAAEPAGTTRTAGTPLVWISREGSAAVLCVALVHPGTPFYRSRSTDRRSSAQTEDDVPGETSILEVTETHRGALVVHVLDHHDVERGLR
jgi:hypothetical protein